MADVRTINVPPAIPKSAERIERDHQGLCDLIRRDVRRIIGEELDRRGLVDRGTNPVSTEEFVRRNPELHGLVRDAVRDALHGIGKRGDRPGRVAGSGVGLGVVRGIYWIAFHALTSLLCVACTILALKAFLEGDE